MCAVLIYKLSGMNLQKTGHLKWIDLAISELFPRKTEDVLLLLSPVRDQALVSI